jgi:ATP-dependent DNA helicase RecG
MIPLKLETLFAGRVVEQNRVEYKKGWNPNDTIQTICAFANDFSNTNGGYVVIGVESENGRPVLPPVGIDEDDLDRIQQELFRFCNFIEPRYLPQSEIVEYQGKKLVYLWCSGGDAGPYQAPTDVYGKSKKKRQSEYWIKVLSVKTAAKDSEKFDLFNKFNSVPFDDRINREATADAVRWAYVEDYLADSNSALLSLRSTASIEDILLALEVAKATDTEIAIRNVGLLMFAQNPEKFIDQAITELKWFYTLDEEGGDFEELTFAGPLQNQIRDALHYIQTSLMAERVVKLPNQAEALRFFNYPYASLEETLVNAHLHALCKALHKRCYAKENVMQRMAA